MEPYKNYKLKCDSWYFFYCTGGRKKKLIKCKTNVIETELSSKRNLKLSEKRQSLFYKCMKTRKFQYHNGKKEKKVEESHCSEHTSFKHSITKYIFKKMKL